MPVERDDRYHHLAESEDDDSLDRRTPAQRDRDRLLYASAFRRLAGITQVVSPAEGHVFHNRLTHTLEVTQIGRRLTEKLLQEQTELAAYLGGLDPDVVEAAALAHDLGHPPFGHIAEETLCSLMDARPQGQAPEATDADVDEGFEGNAQSFRIVTKLAVHRPDYDGLNLTRATLGALLKYPWHRGPAGKQLRKWGAYRTESQDLSWARAAYAADDQHKSAEAEIMDWADDIAYSVHDVEDFYRAGLMPIYRFVGTRPIDDNLERDRFLDAAVARVKSKDLAASYTDDELRSAFLSIMDLFPIREPYRATRGHRAALRSFTSGLISRFIGALRLTDPATNRGVRVTIDIERGKEVAMLKELTWHYVVNNPHLATQQYGQREVIRTLFRIFADAASSRQSWTVFPEGYRERLEALGTPRDQDLRRVAVDLIASMTEQQALRMYQRLTGTALGSVLDPLNV